MEYPQEHTYVNTSKAIQYQDLDSTSRMGISESYATMSTESEEVHIYDHIPEENIDLDSTSRVGISELYTTLSIESKGIQLYDHIPEEKNETIYDVDVCETKASKRHNFHGSYKIVLTDTSLCLLGISDIVTYSWPLKTIRRFGVERSKVFFMEAGRNAPNGEGLFKFKAKHPRDIYNSAMERCKQNVNKTSSRS